MVSFWGVSGKFDVIAPYASLSGTADYAGPQAGRSIHGFANPAFRLSANLVGAPALTLPEFAAYRQDLIVGVSVQVGVPASQYDSTPLLSIGTNRWSVKPEIGVSKAIGSWTIEGQAAVTFYGDNDDFFGGSTRTQEPPYFAGGRSSIDGVARNDLQQNWRVGATLALPVDRRNSIKFAASSGVSARTGNNFDLIAVAWQYRWAAGFERRGRAHRQARELVG